MNSGSTSVKLAIFDDDDRPRWSLDMSLADLGPDRSAGIQRHMREADPGLDGVGAVAHRIVHGADRFDRPVIVNDAVEATIAEIAELAPLHNRVGLEGIHAARALFGPSVPQWAVFDTAFHRTIPPAASTYGGPYEWIGRGLRRYGFHGISHQFASQQAALTMGRPIEELRLVTCHLGGGCSAAAIAGGRSIDTTMGFTPLDGLVMETRAGSVDPALVLHLLRAGATVDEVEQLLETRSGLLGLSGIDADLRAIIAGRERGDERAKLAIDVFVHRVAAGVGAMIAALGGLDALVFTGGIGEHSAEVRERVARPFAFLGADVIVVTTREELAIAQAVRGEIAQGTR